MDFLTLAEQRWSVRKFSGRPVEQEKLDKILRAGQLAPTACNLQPQKTLVIRSADAMSKWRRCTVFKYGEPLVLLTCYDKSICWTREFDGVSSGYVDGSIVMTHMMLEAEELGIGSVWLMYLDTEALRAEFGIPEHLEIVGALALGYAADDAAPSPRHADKKPLGETVVYDRF